MKDKPGKMTLQQFGPWLQEKTGAEIRVTRKRTEGVLGIDHIEAGGFAALYAVDSANGLMIVELAGYFNSKAAAWQALNNNDDTYPPLIFEEWVEQQYLTDRNARVEKLELFSFL